MLPDGMVFEIYPATESRETGALRIGFAVAKATIGPGRHLLRDPDGRTVELHVEASAASRRTVGPE
ncbi:hypothetical protein FHR32_006886 [Streptosporangium album]|uniref:Uncharacterized protein n=1 Tax=Streptosporangium album TaxID=47479 RepID=A0A7W7S2B6_9ACTN|nr:hypothetical protein [Streptosporangium album]MBB4942500.1 hypothetical protein [Streptosporangium album]